jgi:hypothetical protein
MIPDRSLTTRSVPGRKKERARISIHFCCNSDGSERLPMWIIGNAAKPRCFSKARINISNLGVYWRSNKKAWMTGKIMEEWLRWFDNQMSGRKVALLMDNFSAHEAALENMGSELNNTLVIWLPARSTSKYQPLDQGIIRTWKAYWKRQWILYMLSEFDRGRDPIVTITVLQVIRWAIPAWTLDLGQETIRNCYKRALALEEVAEIRHQEVLNEISVGLQKLQLSNIVREAMDINQFLNPIEEQVDDSLMAVDDIVLSQYSAENNDSSNEDEEEDQVEELPQITATEALESLYKLRLFEEQDPDGNRQLIQLLVRHERELLRKKLYRQQQGDIRSFLGIFS